MRIDVTDPLQLYPEILLQDVPRDWPLEDPRTIEKVKAFLESCVDDDRVGRVLAAIAASTSSVYGPEIMSTRPHDKDLRNDTWLQLCGIDAFLFTVLMKPVGKWAAETKCPFTKRAREVAVYYACHIHRCLTLSDVDLFRALFHVLRSDGATWVEQRAVFGALVRYTTCHGEARFHVDDRFRTVLDILPHCLSRVHEAVAHHNIPDYHVELLLQRSGTLREAAMKAYEWARDWRFWGITVVTSAISFAPASSHLQQILFSHEDTNKHTLAWMCTKCVRCDDPRVEVKTLRMLELLTYWDEHNLGEWLMKHLNLDYLLEHIESSTASRVHALALLSMLPLERTSLPFRRTLVAIALPFAILSESSSVQPVAASLVRRFRDLCLSDEVLEELVMFDKAEKYRGKDMNTLPELAEDRRLWLKHTAAARVHFERDELVAAMHAYSLAIRTFPGPKFVQSSYRNRSELMHKMESYYEATRDATRAIAGGVPHARVLRTRAAACAKLSKLYHTVRDLTMAWTLEGKTNQRSIHDYLFAMSNIDPLTTLDERVLSMSTEERRKSSRGK